jgi:hypothetical protein
VVTNTIKAVRPAYSRSAGREHRLRFIDEVCWESRMRPVVDTAPV